MTRAAAVLAAALALAAAALAAAPAADAKRVRVHAVGPKFDLAWVQTREGFRSHLLALVDARLRGAGAAGVQRGAADVRSNLLGGRRDLVALPESLGLMAAFSGTRAATARESPIIEGAIVSLLGAYAPEIAHYGERYPDLVGRFPQTRLLALALTDTFGRVAVETFAEIADRLDSYVVAGLDIAQDWRIVCNDRDTYEPPPGGEPCAEEDPAKVAALMTTDEERDYAYEATTDQASVVALVFDPDGKIVAKEVKTYLTPIELAGQLDLVPGHVSRGLGAVRTPVGTLGIVTSKDAWMPDVTAKLDARGVDVLVQPEFFVGDTAATQGMWAPDNYKASGFSDLQRHPGLQVLVAPSLTGNVFSLSADVQQVIASKAGPRGGLIGQGRERGFERVGRYPVEDPVDLPIAQRRRALGEAGEKMLPGSAVACPDPAEAGACEGGQVEDVIHADVRIGPRRLRPVARRKRGRTPFTAARPLLASRAPQSNVALAARGNRVWAAFQEGRRVVVARSDDGGKRWRRMRAPRVAARQWWPALAAGPDGRVWLAWCDDSTGTFRAYYATARGRRFGRARPLDASGPPDAAQFKPTIAATPDGAVAAWVDERDPVPGEDLQEAGIRFARVGGPSQRIDAGEPVALATTLDHSWAPSLAARGDRLLLAYLDFRTYDWRVYTRESRDGGATWDPEQTVQHSPPDVEALADTPRATFGPRGNPLLAFTDYRKRDSVERVHPLYDVAVAAPGGTPSQVDSHGAGQRNSFAPAIAWAKGRPVVAWQDHARGDADVRVRALEPFGPALRADDAGRRRWNAWRPAVAVLPRGRVLVAWEDDRDGRTRVFAARTRVGRLQ